MKPWMLLLYGLLLGLLLAGLILLISRPIQGVPIELRPAPSATATSLPLATTTPRPVTVQVGGEIRLPDLYSLPKDSRLLDLIALAGGLTPDADENRINYAVLLRDGDYYYIPAFGEDIPETASNAPANLTTGSNPVFTYPLDLNEATIEALESLPGIGPSKAADILAYREENGPFAKVDDLINVPGIGPSTVEALRDYLYVGP